MKKSILLLGVSCALVTSGLSQIPADKAAEGVVMKRGTFWSTYEVAGKFYYLGDWFQESLPTNPTEMEATLATRQCTPEENLQFLLSNAGVTTPEEYAANQGYAQGDINALLAAWGSWDALAQNYGYPNYDAWVNAWWGGNPGEEIVAGQMGYRIPGSGNIEAMLSDYGYASIQDMANAWYSEIIPPTLSQTQINEIAVRMAELPPSTLSTLLGNSPDANSKENLLTLQQALVANLNSGALDTAGWTESDIQTPLLTIFYQSANNSNNPNGEFLAQMDFSALDLTGQSLNNLNLKGSNITGEQINSAAAIYATNLSGLDLTGLSLTGKSVNGTNFSNATGITPSQIAQASDIRYTNLSGLDFQGASLSGKNLEGITIASPINFNGSALNGSTSLRGATLENLDLTGLTSLPGISSYQLNSLAGSTLSTGVLTQIQGANNSSPAALRWTNLNGVSLAGINILHDSFGFNYTGTTGLTGANLKNRILFATMGTMDMTGYNYTGKILNGDFRYVTNMSGTQLNALAGIQHLGSTNFSGRDLTGWTPTYSIANAQLANTTGITASSLVNSANITGINLQGTGITKAQLDAALTAAGKNPSTGNYNTSTISF